MALLAFYCVVHLIQYLHTIDIKCNYALINVITHISTPYLSLPNYYTSCIFSISLLDSSVICLLYNLYSCCLLCVCIQIYNKVWNDKWLDLIILHVEHSHIFLDAIQPGEHAICELRIACVCHHIKNGWGLEITGHLWFNRTTTDAGQTTTPNWLTTRDIWW